jgi:hypothetical protein
VIGVIVVVVVVVDVEEGLVESSLISMPLFCKINVLCSM